MLAVRVPHFVVLIKQWLTFGEYFAWHGQFCAVVAERAHSIIYRKMADLMQKKCRQMAAF
jgi:TorA maturation chaperone TorD